ncbi:hypothetical protein QAD02_018674 [Eretmocerus hayati]|uniref:Uncharacterized protein n=1 Tax=Eretmocerus hayati TaxID=131215 RepID=A0ACC2PHP3_9HYME|nr:hypothetical protein QAD02_018674 [Eretmocerus hayati]
MSAKIEKTLRLQRDRREERKKKIKLESGSNSHVAQKSNIKTVASGELQETDTRPESLNQSLSVVENEFKIEDMKLLAIESDSDYSDSSDSSNPSEVFCAESQVESPSEKTLLLNLRVWASSGIAGPARAVFKCIINHGAYYACERCLVPGFDYMSRIVYPFRNDPERTDESFKKMENALHHAGVSPLVKLKKSVNMIILFILDIMHLNYQGQMKKLLKTWFSSNSKVCKEKLLRVSMRLLNIKNQIPSEFQRSTRTVEDVSKWTANEFREILLYTGPFVLEDLLDEDEYNHFLLFHTGSRILCSSELYKQYTSCAKEYLQRFAMLSEEVYGLHFASLTNHSLAHVADDVENMECPASFFTAFPFENELGECKRFIRSGNRPLGQICTKVDRDLEFNFKKATINTELQILKSKQIDYLFHVQKLKFKNYQFSIKKPDNIIWFKDGSIVEIKSMITSSLSNDPTRLFVIGEQIEILKPASSYPTCSSLLGEYSVKRRSDGNLVKFPLSDMKGKYCLFEIFEMPWEEKKLYAMSDTLSDDELESMQYYIVEVQDGGDPWGKFGLFVVPNTFVSYRAEDDPIIDETKPKRQNAVRSSGGSWYVLYPDPPFSTDDVEMIDGFVENPKSIPPSSWNEKKCVVLGLAEMHQKALELLADMSKIKVSSKPKKLTTAGKKDGLGRMLQPLSEAVQNMAKPQVAHVATTDATETNSGNSLMTAAGTSKENIVSDESNFNEASADPSNKVVQFGAQEIQKVSSHSTLKDILFDAPSVQEISSKSLSNVQPSNGNVSPSPLEQSLPSIEQPQGYFQLGSNIQQQTRIRDYIVVQVKTHITETAKESEKIVLKKVDDKVKELKLAFRNKNKEIAQVMSLDDFKSKHTELTFPIIDCKTFDSLNDRLKDDEKGIRTNLKTHIQTTTNPVADAKDNVNTIFKNLISTKVLVSHTAKNSAKAKNSTTTTDESYTQDKPTMNNTEFYKVVRDSLFGLYNLEISLHKLDEKILLKAIGEIINSRRSTGNNRSLQEIPPVVEN